MSKKRSRAKRSALPGEALMLGIQPQRRSALRLPTCRSAWFTVQSTARKEHVAYIRDISTKGIFFYSDFLPAVGEELDFLVEYLNGATLARLHFRGAVVRVEQPRPGCAPGIAIAFHPREPSRGV
jgi:hypothetical protein